MKLLNDLINSGIIKTIGGILFLAGVTLQFWKFALSGLLKDKIKMKLPGVDILNFTGSKAKSYGILYLLAALGMTWILILPILHEFSGAF